MDQSENKCRNGRHATAWSGDEFVYVPLKKRLELLLSNYPNPDLKLENHTSSTSPCLGVSLAEKKENGHCDYQIVCCAEEQMTETLQKEKRHAGKLGKLDNQENLAISPAAAISDKVGSGSSSPHKSLFTENHVPVKAEYAEDHLECSSLPGAQPAVKSEPEASTTDLHELEHVVLKERLRRLLESKGVVLTPTMLEKQECFKDESDGVKTLMFADVKNGQGSAVLSLANIKTEPDEFQGTNVAAVGQTSFSDFLLVKTECETTDDAYEDELDHMLLRDRMKLLSSRDGPSLDIQQSSKGTNQHVPSKSFKANYPRKRRKTVTDSVETAIEEDAPGLLKVLIDKGVLVGEMKLFGEPEGDVALEDLSTDDTFAELEEVISKLFSKRDLHEPLLKLGPLRCNKGEKANYCLESLLSLVEQVRYLRLRKWPVEWGWCRELQLFIFVFEKHNRIVLERPEYGYATYFFELSDSLPVKWQIKRLVTAMKLTRCSRISILENKALTVGNDLSEGEARVLMGFGWIPNTGLGTMLNYCDRVVHDRWNERDRSDWRLKIGKMLADGYNGGVLAAPTTVVEYVAGHSVEIKVEPN